MTVQKRSRFNERFSRSQELGGSSVQSQTYLLTYEYLRNRTADNSETELRIARSPIHFTSVKFSDFFSNFSSKGGGERLLRRHCRRLSATSDPPSSTDSSASNAGRRPDYWYSKWQDRVSIWQDIDSPRLLVFKMARYSFYMARYRFASTGGIQDGKK